MHNLPSSEKLEKFQCAFCFYVFSTTWPDFELRSMKSQRELSWLFERFSAVVFCLLIEHSGKLLLWKISIFIDWLQDGSLSLFVVRIWFLTLTSANLILFETRFAFDFFLHIFNKTFIKWWRINECRKWNITCRHASNISLHLNCIILAIN